MRDFRGVGWIVSTVLILMVVLRQGAQAAPFENPDKFNQSRICTGKRVDVEKYFIEVLDAFEITHSCLNSAADRLNIARDRRWPVPVAAGMLIDDISAGIPACKKLEQNIDSARRVTVNLLAMPSNEFWTAAPTPFARSYRARTRKV